MEACGLLALSLVFAGLAFDACQFERTSRHRIWAAPPPGRAVGVDPLSRAEQESAQSSKMTAAGGIRGLFRIFVILSLGSLAAAIWLSLG